MHAYLDYITIVQFTSNFASIPNQRPHTREHHPATTTTTTHTQESIAATTQKEETYRHGKPGTEPCKSIQSACGITHVEMGIAPWQATPSLATPKQQPWHWRIPSNTDTPTNQHHTERKWALSKQEYIRQSRLRQRRQPCRNQPVPIPT